MLRLPLILLLIVAGCANVGSAPGPRPPGPRSVALPVPAGAVLDLRLGGDRSLLSAGSDGTTAEYSLPEGRLVRIGLEGPGPAPSRPPGDDLPGVESAWSEPSGRIRRRRHVPGGADLPSLAGHLAPVTALAYGPPDLMLSGDADGIVRVWSLSESRLLGTLRSEARPILGAGWDAGRPVVLDRRGIVLVWDLEGTVLDRRDSGIREVEQAIALGDARWAIRDRSGTAWRVAYVGDELEVRRLEAAHRARIARLDLDREGGRLRAWTSDGFSRDYLWPHGEPDGPDGVGEPPAALTPPDSSLPGRIVDWAESAGGALRALANEEGWLAIEDGRTGERLALRKSPTTCLAFHATRPWLVRGTPDGRVVCERILDGHPLTEWRAHDVAVHDLVLDGDVLVTAGSGREPLRIWTDWP